MRDVDFLSLSIVAIHTEFLSNTSNIMKLGTILLELNDKIVNDH